MSSGRTETTTIRTTDKTEPIIVPDDAGICAFHANLVTRCRHVSA